MANGSFRLGKQSGGTLGLVFPDGVSDTEVVLPESGELATKEYVDTGAGVAFVANDTRVKTALNASGNAPIYALRAYLNYNQETNVIRKSVNISSVADLGTGIMKPGFIAPMKTDIYPVVGTASDVGRGTDAARLSFTLYDAIPPTVNNFTVGVVYSGSPAQYYDSTTVMIMVAE